MTEAQIEQLLQELTFYKEKCACISAQYDTLLHAFKEAQRYRFGPRSEKSLGAQVPQLPLEFCPEKKQLARPAAHATDENATSNVISIAAHTRKKRPQKKFPSELPRREVVIAAPDKQCACCGASKEVVRYETTEILDFKPAVFEVVVQKREVVVCPKRCQASMRTAPNPKRMLPKVTITEDLLAHIIVSKLEDRQPLTHLEKQLEGRFGLLCRRNKLARWFIGPSKAIQPLINLMKDTVRDYDVAYCDPTMLQVLREPGRPATRK